MALSGAIAYIDRIIYKNGHNYGFTYNCTGPFLIRRRHVEDEHLYNNNMYNCVCDGTRIDEGIDLYIYFALQS